MLLSHSHSDPEDVRILGCLYEQKLTYVGLGISLATLELRKVIARLAWEFDWTLASDNNFEFEKEADFEGFWKVPDPLIKFKPRA